MTLLEKIIAALVVLGLAVVIWFVVLKPGPTPEPPIDLRPVDSVIENLDRLRDSVEYLRDSLAHLDSVKQKLEDQQRRQSAHVSDLIKKLEAKARPDMSDSLNPQWQRRTVELENIVRELVTENKGLVDLRANDSAQIAMYKARARLDSISITTSYDQLKDLRESIAAIKPPPKKNFKLGVLTGSVLTLGLIAVLR